MLAGLYFVCSIFSFTVHVTYSDTRLERHNLLGPFNEVITDIACILRNSNLESPHYAVFPGLLIVEPKKKNIF